MWKNTFKPEDECPKFLRDPSVNPATGRKIAKDGDVYKWLEEKCGGQEVVEKVQGKRPKSVRYNSSILKGGASSVVVGGSSKVGSAAAGSSKVGSVAAGSNVGEMTKAVAKNVGVIRKFVKDSMKMPMGKFIDSIIENPEHTYDLCKSFSKARHEASDAVLPKIIFDFHGRKIMIATKGPLANKLEMICRNVQRPNVESSLEQFEEEDKDFKLGENFCRAPSMKKIRSRPEFEPQGHQIDAQNFMRRNDRILLYHGLGAGKCMAKGTPILMFDGTIKNVEDVIVGDKLMGDDSTARTVLSLARGQDDMYDVIPIKGDKYTVNSEHILCLKASGYPCMEKCLNREDCKYYQVQWLQENIFKSKTFTLSRYGEAAEYEAAKFLDKLKKDPVISQSVMEISVKDYLKLPKTVKAILKGYKTKIEFESKDIPFDPYIIGYWLGDGCMRNTEITSQDSAVLYHIAKTVPKYGLSLNYIRNDRYQYRITGDGKYSHNPFATALKTLKLFGDKHIPMIYKCNSRDIRLNVLAGLIDSDGHYNNGTFEFCQKNEKLMDDVVFLARSLGFACYKKLKKTSWTYKGEKKEGTAWRVHISGQGIEEIPTKIPRKRAHPREQIKDALVSGIHIEHVGIGDYYGFTVDKNSRYVIGDFTVTHNSCSSAMIMADYLKRTSQNNLVFFISPGGLRKNFTEEFCTFCPEDRRILVDDDKTVGRIRLFSLDDSSLKKKLPDEFANCLVIIDEAHRLIDVPAYREGDDGEAAVKNLEVLFEMLTQHQRNNNVKLVLMTGTPFPDTLEQHYNCLKLLKPNMKIGYERFESLFEIKDGMYYPKSSILKELYSNCISYYATDVSDIPSSSVQEEIVQVESENPLGEKIQNAMEYENTIRDTPIDTLIARYMKSGRMDRIQARQKAILDKFRAATCDSSRRYSNFIYPRRNMTDEHLFYDYSPEQILQMSPKLALLVKNIQDISKCPGKQLIYCPFKETSGVNLIGRLLSGMGIRNLIYSGDVSNTTRSTYLQKFNAPENDNGDMFKVILITDAAAEGISLLTVRGVHLFNESIYASHMNQVIGRAIRFRSHSRLPLEDRTVTIFRYRMFVSKPNGTSSSPDKWCYEKGVRRELLLREIDRIVKTEWSIGR